MTGQTPPIATPWLIRATTVPNLNAKIYRDQLIHETPSIRNFLDDIRGEKYIISAPKGFGKSLLLIAKSAQLQEADGGLVTGSGGQIIDRPSGVFPNFSHERIHQLKGDYQFWKNIWKVSLMAAAVKVSHSRQRIPIAKGQIGCDEILDKAISDPHLYNSATSFFTYLVELASDQQMRVIRKTGELSAYFSSIRSQISFAIDNVDEYFKPALEDKSLDNDSPTGEYYQTRSNELWTLAQLALVGAAYELTEANSHLRVYCTVRREAFLQLDRYDDQVQQIRGATLSIEYDPDDFKEIFHKNVGLMKAADLANPRASDFIERLLGKADAVVKHRVVAQDEPAFDHILRHTVFRPRDLMHIGAALSRLPPQRRGEDDAFRAAIAGSSKEILAALITEMRPFFPIPDLTILLKLITTNTLSPGDLQRISIEYNLKEQQSDLGHIISEHPFCILYRIGLLGVIQRDLTSDTAKQNFLKPYEITFDTSSGLPPTDEFYLLHPILDQRTLDESGHRYLTNFHSQNIIGDDLRWREPLDSYFVLKGDVCGFSHIMSTELYPALATRLYIWAKSACETLHYFDVFGGDSVVFIDRSSKKLLNAASAFLRAAENYQERPVHMRFGGSAGPVAFQKLDGLYAGSWQQVEVPLGLCLRQASRLEPFAPTGGILVDDEFRRRASETSGFAFNEPGVGLPLEKDEDGRYLLRKSPSDPPIISRLWVASRQDGVET